MLLLAAQSMRLGHFTIGDFTLFATYLGMVSAAPNMVGQILATERQSGVSLQRMRELTARRRRRCSWWRGRSAPRRPTARGDEALRTLSVRGLTRRHPDSGRGVADVDLDLRRGAFVVVTGRVGAGKTTLLRALVGLVPRDAGEILWNGRRSTIRPTFMVPPRSAYTAQAPRLFSETIGDNIRMGEAVSDEALAEAVALAVFDADVASFDAGLQTLVGARGVTLSGGQLQRAAAARMFVRRRRSAGASTTSPAPSTSPPSRRSGAASSRTAAAPASPSPTAAPPSPAPTRSCCSTKATSPPAATPPRCAATASSSAPSGATRTTNARSLPPRGKSVPAGAGDPRRRQVRPGPGRRRGGHRRRWARQAFPRRCRSNRP